MGVAQALQRNRSVLAGQHQNLMVAIHDQPQRDLVQREIRMIDLLPDDRIHFAVPDSSIVSHDA